MRYLKLMRLPLAPCHKDIFLSGTANTGNVTSSGQIKVTGSNASTVAFSVGDAGTGLYNTGSNSIGLATAGEQRLNIDSSGNVIVSGTAAGQATSVALHNTGYVHAVSSHQMAGIFDRWDSDGDILLFRKQGSGTAVGSVGVKTGSLYMGTGDAGIGFNHHGGGNLDAVFPYSITAGAFQNGAVDIG